MSKSSPILVLVTLTVFAMAGDKAYQTTKVIEVTGSTREFCFVVQIDDLAYVSVANEHVPKNLIVGDSIEVRVKNDNLWIKNTSRSLNQDPETKTKIIVRKRMTGDAKPPSCSLSVTLH